MPKKTTLLTVENLNERFGISEERAQELLSMMGKSADKHEISEEEGAHAHIEDILNFPDVTIRETYYLFAIFGIGFGMAIEKYQTMASIVELLN